MTKKSTARQNRDATLAESMGGRRVMSSAEARDVASRSWYELKRVHDKSGANIANIASLLAQYNDPVILMKVADNGHRDRFIELQKSVPGLMKPIGEDRERLWKLHAHRKGNCSSVAEMEAARKLFDQYQEFDMNLLTVFQPIVDEMNAMYNTAIDDLEKIRQQVAREQEEVAKKEPTDVEFKEVSAA